MSTKQCKHCGAVKPIEEFRQTYPGSKCRACERQYSRHYYTRNTVAVRERQGAYRDENIELVRRRERESKSAPRRREGNAREMTTVANSGTIPRRRDGRLPGDCA